MSISNKGVVYPSLSPFAGINIRKYQSYKDGFKRYFAKHRRNLGFHKISFPIEIEFDWHHVNKNDVVAMPRWIHRAIRHKVRIKNCIEGIIG
ncbi:MAG: hypothetical protein KAX49_16595 [Halanaerobiales bacterium]|nr:hypothetical protein [Halanaerobiales bacterium]